MGQKFGLHFGLNTVSDSLSKNFKKLKNAENDAVAYNKICEDLGIETKCYLRENANSSNFISELLSLSKKANNGDFIFLTFSGHGSFVEDVNGDEEDGYDEILVFYDRLVIDDEIFVQFSRFESGVKIFFVTDSCHSGSVSRILKMTNSNSINKNDEEYIVRGIDSEITEEIFRSNDIYRLIKNNINEKAIEVHSSIIHISACQDNQTAWDGNVVMKNGGFTSIFLEVWNNSTFTGSYKRFFHNILNQMPPYQTPNYLTLGLPNESFESETPIKH